MKAILEFDLNDPDDAMAHLRCVNATKMAIALFEIRNNCWRFNPDLDSYRKAVEAEIEQIDIESLIQ